MQRALKNRSGGGGRKRMWNVEGRREIAVDVKMIDLTRMKGIEGIRNSQIVIPEILPKA